VERWKPRLYCTDDWAAYGELIPQGRLFVGKEETHGIERDHSRQRHWLARFRRRTCVVSRAKRMVDASIALFVRFGDNAGIAYPFSSGPSLRSVGIFERSPDGCGIENKGFFGLRGSILAENVWAHDQGQIA